MSYPGYGFTHCHKIRVRYAETDAMGVVYYGEYMTYFEVARVEYLRKAGIDYRSLEDAKMTGAVTEGHIEYKAPAKFDDELKKYDKFLAANVVYKDTGEPIFPASTVKTVGGVKVGFIGLTLEGTPLIVSANGIRDVNFLDEFHVLDLLVSEDGRACGVVALELRTGEIHTIHAKSVLWATGGFGRIVPGVSPAV